MPNTCSNGQQLHTSPVMRATGDSDMTAPSGGGGGGGGVGDGVTHVLGSPGDGVGGAGLQPHPLRRQFGLHRCADAFDGDEGNASAAPARVVTPESGGGAHRSGEVDVCVSSLSFTQRHAQFSRCGLLGGVSEPLRTVECGLTGASSTTQELMASGSTVAATEKHFLSSSAPSLSLSLQEKPHSAIVAPTSRGSNAAATVGSRTHPFAAAVSDSGTASRSSSFGDARTAGGNGPGDVYGGHIVKPLLRSRSGRSGASSSGGGFFNGGADGDGNDAGESIALQAAVDAAVRFDDLASEDDMVGRGGERRAFLHADTTALSHLLAEAHDSDDDTFTCTPCTNVDLLSPFSMPGCRGDSGSERHWPHSPLAPDIQQCGCEGDRSTDGRPQELSRADFLGVTYPSAAVVASNQRAAIGAAIASSSLPYLAASGNAIVPPLQSMQPRTSPAAVSITNPTPTVTPLPTGYAAAHMQKHQPRYSYFMTSASAVLNPAIPTPSLASPQQPSLSMPPSMSGVPQALPPQRPRHRHRQCSSSMHPSPHSCKTPPIAVTHIFPASATAIAAAGNMSRFWLVSPPQPSIAAAHHCPSASGAPMGGSAAVQNGADVNFALPSGTVGSGTSAGVGAQTPSNSLLSSPGVQPFYMYQVPQATLAVEPQQAQQQPPGNTNVLLYSPPQAYVGSGQVVAAHVASVSPSTAAVLGDSTQPRSPSPPTISYHLSAATPQHHQQVIGGYILTPSASAAAAAAAAATPSEESSRPSRNLYFRNLPLSWNTSMLRELCSRYGAVLSAKVAHHSTTNESLRYGFVLFEQKHSAVTCMMMLNQAHVRAEGEEPRTLFVRMAHATAAPGFQEEGASDSVSSSLCQPMESTPLSGLANRAVTVGGRLPQRVFQQQQQQQPANGLLSPRAPLSGSESIMLLPLGSAPRFPSCELTSVSPGDEHRGQARRHSIGDSIKTNANDSLDISCAGGDSLRCTSPVGGASKSSTVAASRESIPSSFSEVRNFISAKGLAKTSASPLRGLPRFPSESKTLSVLSPYPTHQQQRQQEQEGSLSYSSASATRAFTAGATAMAAAAAQCAGYRFCSPLSLSPSDTASLLLSPSVPRSSVQLPHSCHTPSASAFVHASSTKPAPTGTGTGTASATMSTRNVYITNLPLTWNTTKLRELCSQYGEIVSASVAHHPKTNESRGYGFVLFADERDAASCVVTLHQHHVPNSPNVLSCRFAKDKATPSIAYTLLSQAHEPGTDSLDSGSGSPLLASAVGGRPTTSTSKTMAPMVSKGGYAEVLERIPASNDSDDGTSGSARDAVCMPIDVFCTLQQRMRMRCAQNISEQQKSKRNGMEDDSGPTSAAAMADVESEGLEKVMRCCVVYGAQVPTQGYGCVRPVDCRNTSFRRAVTRSHAVGAVGDAAQLLSGPPAELLTPISSGLQSAGTTLSAEHGDPRVKIAGATDAAAPTTSSETVVCTYAIAVGRVQSASPALAGTVAMPAVSSTRRRISVEVPYEQPHRVGTSDVESVNRVETPEMMTSPATPPELWYTCTLFTTPLAAEAFVREASKATTGSVATIDTERGDFSTSGGGNAGASMEQLPCKGKNSVPVTSSSSSSPAGEKTAGNQSMRFGLRDRVMVLSSAPLAMPAATPSTSSANTTTANCARLLTTEELYSQRRPTITPQQQQQPIMCLPSPADAFLRSPLSHAAHYTCPRVKLASPTAGASLLSPTPMMVVGGDGDGSSNPVGSLAFPQGLGISASTGASGWYPSATAADYAYLLDSPSSSLSINVSTGTHILSDLAMPPLGVGLNVSNVSSPHSAVFNAAGPGSRPGRPASTAPAPADVFAAPLTPT
ncbi:RNA recognition motif [Leishmania braziliensis]|nr:RNA recognition motif [Leishmania braziliensis]